MRRFATSLLLIVFTYLSIVVFANRALLFSRFDDTYWKNKYEQSQWKLPLSIRTIGDDGLYLYEGYRLIHGSDPTSSNAEMPPLGKYLIGISIVLFGNGYVYGFFVTTGVLIASYLLTKSIVTNSFFALCVVLLLATDPLITNQYALTMMDALQALLLTSFFYSVLSIHLSQQPTLLLLRTFITGLILGFFSVTKLPVLTPILIIFGGRYLWITTKKLSVLCLVVAGTITGYMIPYIGYFFHGHTIIDWLKIQKWMVSFYLHSNLTPTWGSSLSVLFTGLYQNIFSREWLRTSEWTPVWGVLTFSLLTAIITRIRTKNHNLPHDLLLASCIAIIGIFTCVPFWTRYLVVVLPIVYIVGLRQLIIQLPDRAKIGIVGLLLIINISASTQILFQSPNATAQQYMYNVEHRVFADLYEDTTSTFKHSMSRRAFEQFGHTTMAQGEIEFIDITPTNTLTNRWTSPQYLTANATYFTRHLGSFTVPINIPFVKENGRWRIPWNWSYLLPGLTKNTRLVSTIDEAKRGSILGSDKKPLAQDIEGRMIWITPSLTNKLQENDLLNQLEMLFQGRLPKVAIHQRFVGNTLETIAIPIGVVPYASSIASLQTLIRYPGISFTPSLARAYYPNNIVTIGSVVNTTYPECCSYLYTTTAYTGKEGLEQTYDEILKGTNGGTLHLVDQQGNILKEFLRVTKRNGTTIEL